MVLLEFFTVPLALPPFLLLYKTRIVIVAGHISSNAYCCMVETRSGSGGAHDSFNTAIDHIALIATTLGRQASSTIRFYAVNPTRRLSIRSPP